MFLQPISFVANALAAEDGATDSALFSPIGEVCLVALLLLLLLLLSSHWEDVQRRMAPGLRTPAGPSAQCARWPSWK